MLVSGQVFSQFRGPKVDKKGGFLDKNGRFFDQNLDLDQKAVTLSKHWPGAYELRVRAPQKGHFFMQVGGKKATKNGKGEKGGRRDEKERKMVPKREPKAVKNGVKKEEENW